MAVNKKGIFYAILSILFVSLAVFVFLYQYSGHQQRDRMSVIETRIYSLNDFVLDIEDDLGREIYISGFRTLSALVNHVVKEGEFLTDFNSNFNEAFINGTINNQTAELMNQSTFDHWVSKIQTIADNQDINTTIGLNNISVYHSDAWHVDISANFSLEFKDLRNTANWTRNITITQSIDIRGFEDPLYVVNSYGRVTNIVNQTIHEGNYTSGSGPSFDPDNLEEHAENSWYTENSNASSYLMRLTNNLSASPHGIESMVNLQELTQHGLTVEEKSVIDHIYFSNTSTTDYHVNEMPSWFMIDDSHADKYGCTGETY
jgi:hypothetical protein